MATRMVNIEVFVRDETGAIVAVDSGPAGTTEDDGQTVMVPRGYFPNIANAAPGDVRVIIHNPPTEIGNNPGTGATFVDRIESAESDMQTISLALPG